MEVILEWLPVESHDPVPLHSTSLVHDTMEDLRFWMTGSGTRPAQHVGHKITIKLSQYGHLKKCPD